MALSKTKRETLEMVFVCFSLSLLFPFTKGGNEPSVYQVLQSYNLPIGLLSNGTLSYTLDPNSGQFSVNLRTNCSFQAGGFEVTYSNPITGVISQNNLGKIDGVKVKILVFWVNIINVKRNGDRLEFNIGGLVHKDFPVSDFNSCRNCK
ncbi:hypothetical protein R6Q57_002587 [Mikania cordata]